LAIFTTVILASTSNALPDSHITTHRCILIGYFYNYNFSKHE